MLVKVLLTKFQIFTVNMLLEKTDNDLQKLCKEFDVYLAEECIYKTVIYYLGRHILWQK